MALDTRRCIGGDEIDQRRRARVGVDEGCVWRLWNVTALNRICIQRIHPRHYLKRVRFGVQLVGFQECLSSIYPKLYGALELGFYVPYLQL